MRRNDQALEWDSRACQAYIEGKLAWAAVLWRRAAELYVEPELVEEARVMVDMAESQLNERSDQLPITHKRIWKM